MLRGNKYLREVDVSHNRVNWEGAMLIAKGLKENDTLEILYVRIRTRTVYTSLYTRLFSDSHQ